MSLRKVFGKITNPIFVPLRKIIAWCDQNFGVCDYTFVVVKRESDYIPEESHIMKSLGNFILGMSCYLFTTLALFTTAVLIIASLKDRDADLLMLSVSAALNATLALMCFRTYTIVNREPTKT